MKKIIENNYIIALSTMYGEDITDVEYNELLAIIQNVPPTPEGYVHKLRSDTLEWELVELPPIPEDEEATTEDYEAALAELGVK